MKTKILVGIMINEFQSIEINDKKKDLIIEIWEIIKNKLKDKYIFIEKTVNGSDYFKYIQEVSNSKYDMFVGDFFTNSKFNDKVNFTSPLMVISPAIIYEPLQKYIQRIKYFKYLGKIWLFPLIVIICFSLILGFILSVSKKTNVLKSAYISLIGFFGENKLIDSDKINIHALIVFFCIYFIGIYIQSATTAKSVQFFEKSSILESSIRGKRILVNKKSISKDLIEKNGGIPVGEPGNLIDKNKFVYFVNNKKRLKLDGFLYNSFDKIHEKAEKYGLKVSELVLGNFRVSFPINKKNIQLLKDINLIIQQLDDNETLLNLCNHWGDPQILKC